MEETPDVLPALARLYEETLPQIDRALGGGRRRDKLDYGLDASELLRH